jgi:hypothetical protein
MMVFAAILFALVTSRRVRRSKNIKYHRFDANARLGNPDEALSMVCYFEKASDVTDSMISQFESLSKKMPVVIEVYSCKSKRMKFESKNVIKELCEQHANELPFMIRSFGSEGASTVLDKLPKDDSELQAFLEEWSKYYFPWTKWSHVAVERQLVIDIYADSHPDRLGSEAMRRIEATLPVKMTLNLCKGDLSNNNECKQSFPLLKARYSELKSKWSEQRLLKLSEVSEIISNIEKVTGVTFTKNLSEDFGASNFVLIDENEVLDQKNPIFVIYHIPGIHDERINEITETFKKLTKSTAEKFSTFRVSCSQEAKARKAASTICNEADPKKVLYNCNNGQLFTYAKANLFADLRSCLSLTEPTTKEEIQTEKDNHSSFQATNAGHSTVDLASKVHKVTDTKTLTRALEEDNSFVYASRKPDPAEIALVEKMATEFDSLQFYEVNCENLSDESDCSIVGPEIPLFYISRGEDSWQEEKKLNEQELRSFITSTL